MTWIIQTRPCERLKFKTPVVLLLLVIAFPAAAQITAAPAATSVDSTNTQAASIEPNADEVPDEVTETEIEEAIEADTDGSLDDSINSLDTKSVRKGVGLSADLRVGYFDFDIEGARVCNYYGASSSCAK